MAREYIDPQPFKDRIAELEKQVEELKSAGSTASEPSQELTEITAERDALKVANAELQQKLDAAIAALPKGAPETAE